MKKFIKANYKVLFDIGSYNEKSLSMLGKNMDQKVEVSENTFFSFLKKNLGQLSEISRREFIIGVFLSYNECFGKKFDDDCYICFPIHSRPLIIAECLREDFEELKFIHMTREPVQNISSCMKQYNVKDLSPFNGLLRMATQQVINDIGEQLDNQKLYGNQPYFQDSLKVQSRYVRLEDVHNFGKKELSRIAKWLNIEFEKSMLTSTFMNLEWHNRASSPRITGLNKVTISQRFDEYMNLFDKLRIHYLCWREKEHFRYKTFKLKENIFLFFTPILIFFPFKSEFNSKRLTAKILLIKKQNIYENLNQIFNIHLLLNKKIYSSLKKNLVTKTNSIKKKKVVKVKLFKLLIKNFLVFIFLLSNILLNFFSLRLMMLRILLRNFFQTTKIKLVKPL